MGTKSKQIAVILILLFACAGTENNLTDYSEGMQAYEEVRDCLSLVNMPTPESIGVIEVDELPCGTRACSSTEFIVYIKPELMNVRVWKHELAHLLRLWYYGDIDSRHKSEWFINTIFVCNRGFND